MAPEVALTVAPEVALTVAPEVALTVAPKVALTVAPEVARQGVRFRTLSPGCSCCVALNHLSALPHVCTSSSPRPAFNDRAPATMSGAAEAITIWATTY